MWPSASIAVIICCAVLCASLLPRRPRSAAAEPGPEASGPSAGGSSTERFELNEARASCSSELPPLAVPRTSVSSLSSTAPNAGSARRRRAATAAATRARLAALRRAIRGVERHTRRQQVLPARTRELAGAPRFAEQRLGAAAAAAATVGAALRILAFEPPLLDEACGALVLEAADAVLAVPLADQQRRALLRRRRVAAPVGELLLARGVLAHHDGHRGEAARASGRADRLGEADLARRLVEDRLAALGANQREVARLRLAGGGELGGRHQRLVLKRWVLFRSAFSRSLAMKMRSMVRAARTSLSAPTTMSRCRSCCPSS